MTVNVFTQTKWSCRENTGESHKVTGTGSRTILAKHPTSSHLTGWVRASMRLPLASRVTKHPTNYCDAAVRRAGAHREGFCSAIGDLLGRAAQEPHSQTSSAGAHTQTATCCRQRPRRTKPPPVSRKVGLLNTKRRFGRNTKGLALRSRCQTDTSLGPQSVLFWPFALRDQKM